MMDSKHHRADGQVPDYICSECSVFFCKIMKNEK